jgi:biotin-dependent carboxylase-like uncharacterized protein
VAGAMDPESLELVNLLVGNAPAAAGVEWALGPGRIGVEQACSVAAGPGTILAIAGEPVPAWTARRVRPGDALELAVPAGRFGYLAVSGGVQVPPILGSRSTYLPGRFGGLEGRLIRAGDLLPGSGAPGPARGLPPALHPDDGGPIRVVDGPQADLFDGRAWETFLNGRYVVSPTSDRMGYRLEGPTLSHRGAAALPSEPACPGAIQVPEGGTPIVLMVDGPTVGGYPKLGVVITVDLGRLAQQRPGARPAWVRVSLALAREALEARWRWRAAVQAALAR